MRSIGLDLRQWVDAGLLHIWAARPSAFGLETHLALLAQLVDKVTPSVTVLDGISSFAARGPRLGSDLDGGPQDRHAEGQGNHDPGDHARPRRRAEHGLDVSSMVDTWLLLRNVETGGESNRLLFALKSRGSANSNQVREFVLTDHGVELLDVYVGPEGILTGSARLAQQAVELKAEARRPAIWTTDGASCTAVSPSARPSSPRCKTSSPPRGPSSTRSTCASTVRPPSRASRATWRWADTAQSDGGGPDDPAAPHRRRQDRRSSR